MRNPTMAAASKAKEPQLRVDLPSAKDDRAFTPKVGLIATVGFVVGIAWPRLLGVHVGPDVPGGGGDKPRAAASPMSAASASASAADAADEEAPDAVDSADAPSNKETVVVGGGEVTACKNKKGEKVEECGKLALDRVTKTRLVELSKCPEALGLEGTMSLGVVVNFEKNDLLVVEGKKSSLPMTTVRGVLACAGKELDGLELEKVPHTHAKYTVEYALTFYPPGKSPPEPAAPGEAPPEPAAAGLGNATIVWEKGLLRETPETGKVTGRVPQGTRVTILEEQKGWYLVESGKKKGWLAAGAIGK